MPDPKAIFTGTASYYRKYRRPYQSSLFKDIADYFHLDGQGKLLDIGCGTGELTVPLASYFQTAIGLDPNSEMVKEAKLRATENGVTNVTWVIDRAENIDATYGPLRLTTSGVSFHWMDRKTVLQKIYDLTEKGGGMAIVGEGSPVRGKNKTEPWKAKRQELIIKYLGPERRAGNELHKAFIPDKEPFETAILASAFRESERKSYEYETRRSIDEIVGFLWSTSYANRTLFGESVEAFEQELRAELLTLVPDGIFVESGKTELYLLQK